MTDYGHIATDEILEKTEKKVGSVYRKAIRETRKKLDDYLKGFEQRDAKKLALLNAGEISEAEYKRWRFGQIAISKRWREMVKTLAEDYHNANLIALSIIDGHMAEAYCHNFNFATYLIENQGKIDTSFTLYSAETVERIQRENPSLLPSLTKAQKSQMKAAGDIPWQKGKLESVATQSILQGESVPHMAKRICDELGNTNYKSAVRYARTSLTGAQNAGREDAYARAVTLGVKMKRVWVATLDNRTRHAHRVLDRQEAEVGEPFIADGREIMYPCDPSADADLIWNCRCTTIAEVEGLSHDWDGRSSKAIGGMDYDEWKYEKDTYANAKKAAESWQKKLDGLPSEINDTFDGIWYNQSVTYADWEAKKGSIQAKKDYYDAKMDELEKAGKKGGAEWWSLETKKAELEKFEEHGEEYSKLLQKQTQYQQELANAKARMGKLAPAPKSTSEGNITQERRDAAVWAQTPREADDVLRPVSGAVWRDATSRERKAIFEYTSSYSKFNEPLRGEEYGTNAWKGVGNTDLNAGRANNGDRLNAMTDIISRSEYAQDIWLQRGCGYSGMDRFFQCDSDLLRYGSEAELQAELLGRRCPDYGFFSCGSSKGQGFSTNPIIMNIFAPSGTKMMYVEPFSSFGRGDGLRWDGISSQRSFGSELETILQQGTVFRVTKVERKNGGTIFIDLDVIEQLEPQRWTP